jgi:hypothetical protein
MPRQIGQKKLIFTVVGFTFMLLVLTPQTHAADVITSADWTHYPVSGGSSYWKSCATVNLSPASNLSYSFHYGTYVQTGTLDGNGCFTVTDQLVGTGFGYGSSYTLQARNSPVTTFTVTSNQTLGGSLVATNRPSLLLPTVALSLVAIVTLFTLYLKRSKRATSTRQ